MPAAKEEFEPRVKIVLFGPPGGQYEKSACVVFSANKVEEAVSDAAEFLDDDDVIDKFRVMFSPQRIVDAQAAKKIIGHFQATEETAMQEAPKSAPAEATEGEPPSEKTGYNQECKHCGEKKTRGPLSGKYGPWYGCNTKGCKLGPR